MQIDYQQELKRKAFHLSALILPLLYLFTSRTFMIIFMMIIASGTIYIDKVRHHNPLIQELVDKFFKDLMRPGERSGSFMLSGMSYMMAGFFISALLFPKGVAIAAWLVLIISDSVAAIVGKQIGTPRNHGKSAEGAIAFFLSSLMICLFSYSFAHYNGSFLSLVLACCAASAVEYYSPQVGINDNLTIPVTFGAVMTIFGWLL